MSRRRSRRPQPTTDQRTPEQRLEALVREDNLDRAERMLMRISDDLDATRDPGPWIDAARTLSERLIISDDALYYFAEMFSECVLFAATETDPELQRLSAEMDAIERSRGLRPGDAWRPGEAPAEWHPLNDAWTRRADEIVVSKLRELGHTDLATLREQKPEEFQRRIEKGRVDLWGEDEDEPDEESSSGSRSSYGT